MKHIWSNKLIRRQHFSV